MILSASGWRKVFALSGDEHDKTPEIGDENKALAALAADTFSRYIKAKTQKQHPEIVVGTDSRPTCIQISDMMLRVFCANKIPVRYVGVAPAPEVMNYARGVDAFAYISASHNPIGYNGMKFGLNDGGVISATESKKLISDFEYSCRQLDAYEYAMNLAASCNKAELDWIYAEKIAHKTASNCEYRQFIKSVIAGTNDAALQNQVFCLLRKNIKARHISILCDMNGSSRISSIDSKFFHDCCTGYYPINNKSGEIVHEIIPEPENLIYCANNMDTLHKSGHTDVLLGYMPDCDGDRGNIVYWNEKKQKSCVLAAQEVFALSVLSELSFATYMRQADSSKNLPLAVVVNCPTSMRIDEIATAFGAKVFRAEVGEANVVSLAQELREKGYDVRILGEGSNGGTIITPSRVRDPLASVMALLKLLTIGDSSIGKGLFHLWLEVAKKSSSYKESFTLADVLESLSPWVTTGISDPRAALHIKTQDHAVLKQRFQAIFEKQWELQKDAFLAENNIYSYKAFATNGTKEIADIKDFGISGRGGLKIIFYDKNGVAVAFIWQRGSGTESIFRILCDVKGNNKALEEKLLSWEKKMIQEADVGNPQ